MIFVITQCRGTEIITSTTTTTTTTPTTTFTIMPQFREFLQAFALSVFTCVAERLYVANNNGDEIELEQIKSDQNE